MTVSRPEKIFEPINIGRMTVKNRIEAAPATSPSMNKEEMTPMYK